MSSGTSYEERTRTAAEWLVRLSCCTPGEAEIAAWHKWLKQDGENIHVFEDLQRLWVGAKKMPPSAETLAVLLETKPQGVHRSSDGLPERWWIGAAKERRTGSRLAAALIASAALATAATILANLPRNRVQVESLTTQVAQNDTVVLRDGTKVDLGGRSAVQVKYTNHQRLLELLSGEAYFQDRDYAKWPFVVSAGDLRVKAIGTAFDIERDENEVAVSVVRGLVEVLLTGRRADATAAGAAGKGTVNEPALLLRPGDKAAIYADGSIHEYVIDPDEAIAWRRGRLEFTKARLQEVIAAVNRYAPRPIVVASPAVGAMRFTGTVFVRAIGQWVDDLPTVFPLTVDASDPNVVVLRVRNSHPNSKTAWRHVRSVTLKRLKSH